MTKDLGQFREEAATLLQSIDRLHQKEQHSERIKKVIEQDSAKYEQLTQVIKKAQEELEHIKDDKSSVLESIKKEAEDILNKAKIDEMRAQEHLDSAKKLDSIAKGKVEEAEKLRLSYETSLADLKQQKERIRAALD